jgi:hypothetical protein
VVRVVDHGQGAGVSEGALLGVVPVGGRRVLVTSDRQDLQVGFQVVGGDDGAEFSDDIAVVAGPAQQHIRPDGGAGFPVGVGLHSGGVMGLQNAPEHRVAHKEFWVLLEVLCGSCAQLCAGQRANTGLGQALCPGLLLGAGVGVGEG